MFTLSSFIKSLCYLHVFSLNFVAKKTQLLSYFLLQGESRLKYQQVVKTKFEQSKLRRTPERLKNRL